MDDPAPTTLSYLLRLRDDASKAREFAGLVADLTICARLLTAAA